MTRNAEHPGLVGRVHALVAGTRLEAPGRAVSRRLRRALYGPEHDGSVAPAPADHDDVPMFVPPGHFYSPVPSVADIDAYEEVYAARRQADLPGVELRFDEQLALLKSFATFYAEQPFPAEQSPETRFWFHNPSFGYADALAYYCMLRSLRPRHVIEVGSGWSSCVLLDTCERHLDWEPELTMIEPYPDQLLALARPGDLERVRLIAEPVQAVALDEFAALGDGDILFIDSTHVSRVGSDVNREIFDILPALAPGVYVHFHDIFYPFDYPPAWLREGRGWNEAYLLRAFLECNDEFEIVLFNDLLAVRAADRLARDLPLWHSGGSLWLRKRGPNEGGGAVG